MPGQPLQDGIFGFAEVTLDKAGRFVIPVEFFERLKGREPMRILVDPQDRCLELRTEGRFQELVARLARLAPTLPPETVSVMMTEYLGYSLQVQIDNAYRLTIPKRFRELLGDDEIVLIGAGEALQIWSRTAFRASQKDRRRVLSQSVPALTHAILGVMPDEGATGEAVAGAGAVETDA